MVDTFGHPRGYLQHFLQLLKSQAGWETFADL